MPMRLFWAAAQAIPRIEAEQDRRQLRIAVSAQSGEQATALDEALTQEVGFVASTDESGALNAKFDREGFERLRGLAEKLAV